MPSKQEWGTKAAAGVAVLAVCLLGLPGWAQQEPAAPPQAERIAKLVAALGDSSYQVREQSQKELIEIGPPAVAGLETAARSDDQEVRQRAEKALAEIRAEAARRATQAAAKNVLWMKWLDAGVVGSPAVAGRAVVCVGQDDRARAVEASTGKELWELGADTLPHLAAAGQTIYLCDYQGRLLALDAATGKSREKFSCEGVHGPPAVAGKVIYVRGVDSTLRALDAETGRQKWRAELGEMALDEHPPAVLGDTVFVATRDGKVHALEAATGKARWVASAGKQPAVALGVCGKLLVLRMPGEVQGYQAETGQLAWKLALAEDNAAAGLGQLQGMIVINGRNLDLSPRPARAGMACDDAAIYLTVGERVLAVDGRTGAEMWTYAAKLKDPAPADGGSRIVIQGGGKAQVRMAVVAGNAGLVMVPGATLTGPTVAGGVLYFGSREGLHALDLKSRCEIWKLQVPWPVSGPPVIAGGVIYFGTLATPAGGLVSNVEARGARVRGEKEKAGALSAVRLESK